LMMSCCGCRWARVAGVYQPCRCLKRPRTGSIQAVVVPGDDHGAAGCRADRPALASLRARRAHHRRCVAER
jgi:hypothetical protein